MLFPNFITIFATSTDVYNAAFASHYYTKAIDTSDKTAPPKKTKTDYNPMNKIIALIIACTFCIASSYAVEPRLVQLFEFEGRAGLTLPLGGYHGGNNQASMSFGLELRYNTEEQPWDCGVFLQLDGANRHFDIPNHTNGYWHQTNRTWAYGITGDYNFRQEYRVNPFVGIGVGTASIDQVGSLDCHTVSAENAFVFMPRAGVELFHHIRLTAHCMIVRRGFHTTALTIGFVIGGRPKKKE